MIHTKRLILKPYGNEDKEDMLRLLYNEQIKKTYMIPDFKSEEEAEKLFFRLQELSYQDDRVDRGAYLDGKLIGFLNAVDIQDEKIEVGYVMDPAYQNQGYTTEMLSAVIEALFDKGYAKVLAGAFEENVASRRVMEKCHMFLQDTKEEIEYRGKVHQCVYYAIKRE